MTAARRRWRPLLASTALAALLGGLLAVPAAAQQAPDEPRIDVALHVRPDPVRIGDHVTLSIVAEHDANVIVTARPPRAAGVDLVTARLPETQALADGRERTVIEFVVQPFGLGALDIEAIRVDWLREDSTTGSVTLSGEAIEVVPLRPADDDALRALRAQAAVPGAPAAWVQPVAVVVGAAVLAFALAGAGFWLYLRLRSDPPLPVPDTTAEEQARAMLNTLTGMSLARDEDFQRFYGSLSTTIRSYLQERFGFNATAFTTTELEERMASLGIDRWQARLVGGLLERADAAVYARRYPDPASADHDLTMAFEIVELSRPRIEEPEEEAVGV